MVAKRLSFSTSLSNVFKDSDAIFIAVGTPTNPNNNKADLKYVYDVIREVADLINKFVSEGLCTFIESTSASDYWIDTGTNESLVHATNFVRDLKKNSGISIAHFEKLSLS